MFVLGDSRKQILRKTLKASPGAKILAFNLVVFEGDHNVVLEIGCSRTTLRGKPHQKRTFHYIIKENLRYMCEF